MCTTQIHEITKELLGQKAWGIRSGIGSFLTMEFGRPLSKKAPTEDIHGEWHLWAYHCAWRIEKDATCWIGSEDSKEKIQRMLPVLEGGRLTAFDVSVPGFDAILEFNNGIILRLFSVNTEDEEQWMLFTPARNVLVAGPGDTWAYEPAS